MPRGFGLLAKLRRRAALIHRIAVEQAFPLELKVPNTETREAMAEADEMVSTRAARLASAHEMFTELEAGSDR